MPEITVYSKPNCQQCTATVRHLNKRGLAHVYRDVTTDPNAADAVRALEYTGLPVVTVGDMHWSGYRHAKLEQLAGIVADVPDISDLEAAAVAYLAEEV